MDLASVHNSACVSLFLLSDNQGIIEKVKSGIADPVLSLAVSSLKLPTFPIAAVLKSDIVLLHLDHIEIAPVLSRMRGIQADAKSLKFVVLDECASPERAVQSMKAGADDYFAVTKENIHEQIKKVEQLGLDSLFEIPQIPLRKKDQFQNRSLYSLHKKIQKVVRAAKFLATCRSLQEICEGLLDTIGDALGATGGSIYLMNGDSLEQVYSLDPGHAPVTLSLPLEKGSLFEQVFSSGEPLLLSDHSDIPAENLSGWTGYEGESVLVYPLVERTGEIIGLFSLHGKRNESFSKEDRDLVLILASYSHETIRSLLAQERTKKAFDRLNLTFENMSEGIILLGKDNRIIQCNQNVNTLLSLEEGGIQVGQKIADLYEHLFERGDLSDKYDGECPWDMVEGEFEYIHFCENDKIVKFNGNPLPAGGRVLTLTDITSQKNWESELFQAKERAEAASQSKTNFLANVSHELRTPLNAIIGFSEMMSMEVFGPMGNERYSEYAHHIQESGSHLLQLINNLLDLSKVEAGKFQLQKGMVDLPNLLERTSAFFVHQAEEAGVDLVLKNLDAVKEIWADENAIRQIVLNLISNAIKFTPRGGSVEISVSEESAKSIQISVSDTGIGMEKKSLELALQPFGQIENTFNRKYPGTGLGLPLVASLSELHGGNFEIDSALGEGTVCQVSLPIQTEQVH